MGLSFYWWREYQDGRIEQEFNLDTGKIMPWGSKTPDGLKKVAWMPVTPDLAQKMRSCGEFGIPTQAPSVELPVHPGEEPVVFKECTVWSGFNVHCKACGLAFKSKGLPQDCPECGAKPAWRCMKCTALSDTDICHVCNVPGRSINPFETSPVKWEEGEYFLGIKGKFVNHFNTTRMITEH